MIVAGIGCRKACDGAEILTLLRRAEALAGCRAVAIAIPAFRDGAAGPAAAAAAAGLPLVLVDRPALEAAQPHCPTRSARAACATGLASVAEACALAGGGTLLLPRIASAAATCALAQRNPA